MLRRGESTGPLAEAWKDTLALPVSPAPPISVNSPSETKLLTMEGEPFFTIAITGRNCAQVTIRRAKKRKLTQKS